MVCLDSACDFGRLLDGDRRFGAEPLVARWDGVIAGADHWIGRCGRRLGILN